MTQPVPPDGLTPGRALALAGAVVAGQSSAVTAAAVTTRASEGVIAARERAQAWARRVIGLLWRPVDPFDGAQVAAFTVDAAARMATAQQTVATAAAGGQQAILSAVGVPVKARPYVPLDVRAKGAVFRGGRVELVHDPVTVTYEPAVSVTVDGELPSRRTGVVGDPIHRRVSVADASTEEIFNRPARAYRWAKSKGATDEQARQIADSRLDGLIDGNLMLAQRLAEVQVLDQAASVKRSPIVGMRRVIHPELSRGGTCGLCIAASDRLYTVRELLPIHANCKCTTAPVTKDHDPGDDVNKAALDELYRHAGGTSRAHLTRTRYQVDQHGELGPVLAPQRAYKPRSEAGEKAASAIAPSSPESKADIARRHLPILEDNLTRLRDSGLGEDSPQVTYHRDQITRMRADLDAEDEPKPGSDVPNVPIDPGGRTGFGDLGDDEFERIVDHAWDRHAPDAHSRGQLDTKLPEGTTREQFAATIAKIVGMDRATAPAGDPNQDLVARLDTGEIALSERRDQHTNLLALVDGVRYEVRLAKRAGKSTAHPIDGEGVVRHVLKGGEITAIPMPRGSRPVAGWDRPR